MPTINHCLLCEKNSNSDAVSLTNGNFVHRKCANQKIKKYIKKKEELIGIKNDIWEYEREIEKNNSFIRSIFGGERKIEKFRSSIDIKNRSSEEIKNQLLNFSIRYKDILDFWPDYPVDWEERRERLIQIRGSRCENCRSTKVIQLHHLKPIKRGGSHQPENLLVLCRDCHQNRHHHSFEKIFKNKIDENYNSNFEKKVDHIRSAISSRLKIKISYVNASGKKSTRQIEPKRFISPGESSELGVHVNLCVVAYCHLRKEERVFTVSNINKIF